MPEHANRIARLQVLAGGYLARRPKLSRLLEWLGWNNPGAGMNP